MHCYARELFLTTDNRRTWMCILFLLRGNSIKGLTFGSFKGASNISHLWYIKLKISPLHLVGTSDPSNKTKHQTHGLVNFEKKSRTHKKVITHNIWLSLLRLVSCDRWENQLSENENQQSYNSTNLVLTRWGSAVFGDKVSRTQNVNFMCIRWCSLGQPTSSIADYGVTIGDSWE